LLATGSVLSGSFVLRIDSKSHGTGEQFILKTRPRSETEPGITAYVDVHLNSYESNLPLFKRLKRVNIAVPSPYIQVSGSCMSGSMSLRLKAFFKQSDDRGHQIFFSGSDAINRRLTFDDTYKYTKFTMDLHDNTLSAEYHISESSAQQEQECMFIDVQLCVFADNYTHPEWHVPSFKPVGYEFYERNKKTLVELRDWTKFADVAFETVGGHEPPRELDTLSHRTVLCQWSNVFNRMFSAQNEEMIKTRPGTITNGYTTHTVFVVPVLSEESELLEQMISHFHGIYAASFSLPTLCGLLQLADKYECPEYRYSLEKVILSHQVDQLSEHIIDLLILCSTKCIQYQLLRNKINEIAGDNQLDIEQSTRLDDLSPTIIRDLYTDGYFVVKSKAPSKKNRNCK